MNASSAGIRNFNDCDMEVEEEDNENWALPASTLPGQTQAMQYGPSLLVLSQPTIPGNQLSGKMKGKQDSKSDNGRVSNIELNTNKAGMEGLDKEKINKIIMEASKGSRYYENQKKREQQTTERITKMMEKLSRLTESEKQTAFNQVDEMVRELELSRDLSRTIVHLDMDMFYAAVEMRDNPELREKPMAVGGENMLSTSNYKARRFGVRAAMPGFIAKKLCPELVLVPCHFDKYRAVSKEVRQILAEYDPNFCPMSLDEAYFDLTEYLERRQTMSIEERSYPYHSEEQSGKGVGSENGNTEEGSSKECGQFKEAGSISGNGSSLPENGPKQLNDDNVWSSEEASACNNRGKVVSGNILSDLTKLHRVNGTPVHHRNTSSSNNCEVSTLGAGEYFEEQKQGVENEDGICGEKSQDVRFETFGLTGEEVVREIRFRIEQKTRLTASAGIAPNCMLAKICSDYNKPNGQYSIQPTREDVMDFIKDLPIRKISGIGKVTERMLSALGIQTCTDLYQQRALCHLLFSQTSSSYFLNISLGLGSTRVERDGERKSISTERTFREISVPSELYSKCMELCKALAEDLQREQIHGKTVTVKLKTVNFEVKSRASSRPAPVSSAQEIFAVARELLRTEIRACHPQPLRLRLMGVRLSALQDASKSSKSKQGTLLAMFAKKQNTREKPGSTPESAKPQATVQGESTFIHGVNTTESRNECRDQKHQLSDTETSLSSESVNNGVNKLHGTNEEDRVSSLAPCNGEHASVTTVDCTIPSDTELGHEETINSTNTEVNTRTNDTYTNPHTLLQTSHPQPIRPSLNGSDFESRAEENLISYADSDGEEGNTEQLYHPDTLLKSELYNPENNQRVDKMLKKINAHVRADSDSVKSDRRDLEENTRHVMTCPICGQERAYASMDAMNRHVDLCLNKSAIKEILHDEDKPSGSSTNQSQRRKSSPKKPTSRKRSHSGSGTSASSKKRSKSMPSCRTLHDFFQKQN